MTFMESPISKRQKLNPFDATSVLKAVLELYSKLPKKGKPPKGQITTLAAVVLQSNAGSLKVIALATGTKCLSKEQTSDQRLNDSHAEILAKRAATDYALLALQSVQSNQEDETVQNTNDATLFEWDTKENKILLQKDVEIYLVVTRPPCGDAAISVDSELGRTGAKPIEDGEAIPCESDVETGSQNVGVLRRKPGKGKATTSVSCSDKILRWSFLGFQGSKALDVLPCPLYFNSIIVCAPEKGKTKEWQNSIERAIAQRALNCKDRIQFPFRFVPPKVFVLDPMNEDFSFPFFQNETQKETSNSCIHWTLQPKTAHPQTIQQLVCGGIHEATLGSLGIKMGSPKQPRNEVRSPFQSRLCREQMHKRIECMIQHSDASRLYRSQWNLLQESPSIFSNWLSKSHSAKTPEPDSESPP